MLAEGNSFAVFVQISDESDSEMNLFDDGLFLMECESETICEKFPDGRHLFIQERFVVVQENKIIDIPQIVPRFQSMFRESVEFVQVDIREKLTREVAYGHTDERGRIKKRLSLWNFQE